MRQEHNKIHKSTRTRQEERTRNYDRTEEATSKEIETRERTGIRVGSFFHQDTLLSLFSGHGQDIIERSYSGYPG